MMAKKHDASLTLRFLPRSNQQATTAGIKWLALLPTTVSAVPRSAATRAEVCMYNSPPPEHSEPSITIRERLNKLYVGLLVTV